MEKVLTVFFFIFILTACTEQTVNNYYYTGKPGSLTGKVSVNPNFNQYDNYDLSGVEVLVLNTGQKTFTDTTGAWVIDSLYAGVYDIAFWREDCDSTIEFAYQFAGNGYGYYVGKRTLYMKNRTTVKIDSITSFLSHTGKYNYGIHGTASQSTSVQFCLGKNESVSFDNCVYRSNYGNSYIDGHYSFSLTSSNEYLTSFSDGDTVFVCLYAGSFITDIDKRTGYTRYYGFGNKSNVVSFVYKEK